MGRLFRLWVRAGPAIAAAASHRQAFNRRRQVPAISAETAVVARDLAESSAIFYMRATLHGRKPAGAGPAFAQIVTMTGLQNGGLEGPIRHGPAALSCAEAGIAARTRLYLFIR
jgi:hypothetical protein